MKTPKKRVPPVLDHTDPANAEILALRAAAQKVRPDRPDKPDGDVVNEGLSADAESRFLAALFGGPPVHLWLDDLRPAPEGWRHVHTANQAIAALSGGKVTAISLDHDLGDDEGAGTGYDVAVWIEMNAAEGTQARLAWAIHSANPVGRDRMKAALESADRLWDRGETSG